MKDPELGHGYSEVCIPCEKGFRSERGFLAHVESKHQQNVEADVCRFCGFRFTDHQGLRRHMIETENHGFHKICFGCWKGFKSEQGYGTHMKLKHRHSRK